jgi:hypothetical protein
VILPIACPKSNLGVMRPPHRGRADELTSKGRRLESYHMQSAVFNSAVKRGMRVPLAVGGLLAA